MLSSTPFLLDCRCSACDDMSLWGDSRLHLLTLFLPPKQHPHEEKQRLATVPLLELCLARCSVVKGRKFKLGQFPELDICGPSALPREALDYPDDPQGPSPAGSICAGNSESHSIPDELEEKRAESGRSHATCLMLFPSRGAVDLQSWTSATRVWAHDARDPCLLVVVDGSWQHAQEMVKSSRAHLDPRVTFVRMTKSLHSTPSDICSSSHILDLHECQPRSML